MRFFGCRHFRVPASFRFVRDDPKMKVIPFFIVFREVRLLLFLRISYFRRDLLAVWFCVPACRSGRFAIFIPPSLRFLPAFFSLSSRFLSAFSLRFLLAPSLRFLSPFSLSAFSSLPPSGLTTFQGESAVSPVENLRTNNVSGRKCG